MKNELLELTLEPISDIDSPESFSTLYVTAEAYPFFLPMRNQPGVEHKLSGRVPRVLSLLFTTAVNIKTKDYDPKTRTLTIGRDFRQAANRAKLLTGGSGYEDLIRTILEYRDLTFTNKYGKEIHPIKSTTIKSGERWSNKTIVFTAEYEKMMKRNPKTLPLSALPKLRGRSVAAEILVLAALYTPEEQRLAISRDDLPVILQSTGTTSQSPAKLIDTLEVLNFSQESWNFSLTENYIVICPFRTDVEVIGTMQLVRQLD